MARPPEKKKIRVPTDDEEEEAKQEVYLNVGEKRARACSRGCRLPGGLLWGNPLDWSARPSP